MVCLLTSSTTLNCVLGELGDIVEGDDFLGLAFAVTKALLNA